MLLAVVLCLRFLTMRRTLTVLWLCWLLSLLLVGFFLVGVETCLAVLIQGLLLWMGTRLLRLLLFRVSILWRLLFFRQWLLALLPLTRLGPITIVVWVL